MSTKKVTEELRIDALKARFGVEYGGPDAFIKALEDGTIDDMLKACADSMYGGDYTEVLKQLIKNCQDKKCRRAYRSTVNSRMLNVDKMVDAFDDYLHKVKSEKCGTTNRKTSAAASKVCYEWTVAEIEALDDAETARHLYNNLSSVLKNNFSGADESTLSDKDKEFMAHVKELRTTALAQKNKLKGTTTHKANKAEVSDDLLNKLAGGKAVLSTKQVEELRKLLGL